MKTTSILLKYLAANGVVNDQGDKDILRNADTEENATDSSLKHDLSKNNAANDFYMLTIFIALGIVFLVIIFKMVKNIDNTHVTTLCTLINIILVAIMHRVWRDKSRSASMMELIEALDKKDRLKFIANFTNDKDKVFDLNIKGAIKFLFGMSKK